MKKSLISLIFRFISIYFSKVKNKENLYKKELFYFLKAKSGVYNKFLQVLCITHKFMEGWSGTKELTVYNQAEREYINLQEVVPNYESYNYITEEPIAVGSFAQVYRAENKNNEVLALKILKPSVYHNLKHDLKTLKRLVRLANIFMPSSFLDFNEAIDEFNNICITETDYEREIYNLKYFYEIYSNHPYIVIPKVYEDLSNDFVIAQEFIEGITLSDILSCYEKGEDLSKKAESLTGSNLFTQLAIVGGELLRCAMTKEFTYGDPHPGNIILLNNNRVAYIDFGIVGRKPLSQKAFYDWTKSYYDFLTKSNNSLNGFKSLIDTTCHCFCPDFINALNFCTDNKMVDMISNALTKKLTLVGNNNNDLNKLINDGHMFKVFTDFMNNKNLFCLSMDMRNFQLLKAMQAYICTITTIDKRFKTNNFTEIMIYAMEYAFSYLEKEEVPYDYIQNSKYSRGDAIELIDNLLSSLAGNDEFLFQNIYKEMQQ